VICLHCGAAGPNDVSEAKAVEMWNLRRPADAQAQQLAACDARIDALRAMGRNWQQEVERLRAERDSQEIAMSQMREHMEASQQRAAELSSAIWAAVNLAHERIGEGYGCPLCKEMGGFYDHDVYEHWTGCLLAEYEKLVGVVRPNDRRNCRLPRYADRDAVLLVQHPGRRQAHRPRDRLHAG